MARHEARPATRADEEVRSLRGDRVGVVVVGHVRQVLEPTVRHWRLGEGLHGA